MMGAPIARLPPILPANSFRTDPSAPKLTRALMLAVDGETGLLSLGEGFSADELRHNHEWLEYLEPETHCLGLGREIRAKYVVDRDSMVGGLSWKDVSLVAGLQFDDEPPRIMFERGQQRLSVSDECDRVWITDTVDVQESVSLNVRVPPRPQFDFLSARHALEHAFSVGAFLDGLASMVHPDGYVLIEVPDCLEAIREGDYSILWEEHLHYFTSDSLERLLRKSGWRVADMRATTVEGEAVLIALVQPGTAWSRAAAQLPRDWELTALTWSFVSNFDHRRETVLQQLRKLRQSGASMYVLGANHVASNFVDLFAEPGIFDACLDDNSAKQGRYLSAADIPILPVESELGQGAICVLNAIHPGRRLETELRLLDRFGERLTLLHPVTLLRSGDQL